MSIPVIGSIIGRLFRLALWDFETIDPVFSMNCLAQPTSIPFEVNWAMVSNFDELIDRRCSDSIKWNEYGDDVLPLWIADMDFRSSDAIIRALHERIEHGVFGYACEPPALRGAIVARLHDRFHWDVPEDALVFLPGVITGFNLGCHSLTVPGEGILVQTPVYPPILQAYKHSHLRRDEMELTRRQDGSYEIDFDAFEAAICDDTRVFLLCNPHNPVGRVFYPDELVRMAEICLRKGITIISDEIHCDLIYSGYQHTPIASLAPEIEARTITLMAPSKTFNIAGLDCSFAIIPNAEMRRKFQAARQGIVGGVNLLGFTAAAAAYEHGQPWLSGMLAYLESNRDYLIDTIPQMLPGIQIGKPEGTYLAWLDCTRVNIPTSPSAFFLEHAKVAMNDGAAFGKGGDGFCRLNFGCPRKTLEQSLARMQTALAVNETC